MKQRAAPVDFSGRPAVLSVMVGEDARKAAISWCVLLCSGEATPADRARWRQWLDADHRHREAWERIEAMRSSMRTSMEKVPAAVAVPVLRRAGVRRRAVLRGTVGVLAGGSAAGLGWRLLQDEGSAWHRWTAEERSRVGERRVLALADGSRLAMNTHTALNLRFDESRRLVQLVAGEVWIQTAARVPGAAADPRPFVVATPEGTVRALGTRFLVRSEDGRSSATVLRDAVEVRIGTAAPRLLKAGQRMDFTGAGMGATRVADAGAGAWEQGSVVVDDVPLGDLVRELSRYRPGRLVCDDAVAGLRVSGAFPVADTDKALAVLQRSLPVRIRRLTDYWVTVASGR